MPPASERSVIEAKVKAVSARNPVYAGPAAWMGGLLARTLRAAYGAPGPDTSPQGKERLARGQSYLDPETVELDWARAGSLYRDLAAAVEQPEEGRDPAARLEQALEGDEVAGAGLFRALLTGDLGSVEDTAQRLGLDPPVLALLLRLALRPQLRELAAWFEDQGLAKDWSQGHCPLCGSLPLLASLDPENGARRLHCGLCESSWPYPRLKCPFCENQDQEKLEVIKAEEEAGLRVETCQACGHHLRTLDLRELDETVVVPLDEVATWHLEELVRRSRNA